MLGDDGAPANFKMRHILKSWKIDLSSPGYTKSFFFHSMFFSTILCFKILDNVMSSSPYRIAG